MSSGSKSKQLENKQTQQVQNGTFDTTADQTQHQVRDNTDQRQQAQTQDQTQTSGAEQWARDQGQDIFSRIKDLIGGSSQFKPYEGELVAGNGQDFDKARAIANGVAGPSGDLASARTMLDKVGGSLRPNGSIADFMSPYTEGVLSPTLRKMAEAHAGDQNALAAQAAGAGAFGDARHGVEEAQLDRDNVTNVGDATNRAYDSAFTQGNAQRNLERTQAGQIAGQYGALDSQELGRGTTLSKLFSDLNNQDRGVRQAQDEAAKGLATENRDEPVNQLVKLMQALNLAPKNTVNNTTGNLLSSLFGNQSGTTDNTGQTKSNGTTFGNTQGSSQGITTTEKPDNTGTALLGKLGGTLLGSLFGGPMGAAAGGGLGSIFGNLFGGGGDAGGGGDGPSLPMAGQQPLGSTATDFDGFGGRA